MGLLSTLKRKTVSTPPAAARAGAATGEPSDGVAVARTRARQRLIGAVVLVGAGLIVFPIVFETQPRPVAIDIPIEIPNKDALPPLAMPATPVRPASSAPTAAVADPVSPAPDEVITETRADAGRDVAPEPPVAGGESPERERPAEKAAPRPAAEPRPVALPETRAAAASDAARAKALLEGRDVARAEGSRFIVQLGAFAEPGSAQEARQKIEKLGLKTYTQVAETPGGSRIRVRVGPFASRDDADKALAKARAAGVGGVVLVL